MDEQHGQSRIASVQSRVAFEGEIVDSIVWQGTSPSARLKALACPKPIDATRLNLNGARRLVLGFICPCCVESVESGSLASVRSEALDVLTILCQTFFGVDGVRRNFLFLTSLRRCLSFFL